MLSTLEQHHPREQAYRESEFTALFKALENQGVDQVTLLSYVNLYNGVTSVLKLRRDSDKIKPERGERQGDNILPKRLTACLQDAIIKRVDGESRGLNIDGEYTSPT